MKKTILPPCFLLVYLSACITVVHGEATPPIRVDTAPIATVAPTSLNLILNPTPTLLWNVAEWYRQVDIKCETYFETAWGDGSTDWGDPSGGRDAFPHLAFNQQGEIYLLDMPNHRLLKYDGINQSPIQTIVLSEKYHLTVVSAPFITEQNILIPHSFNELAILSLIGQQEKNVQLPINFSPLAPIWTTILVDSEGGLFVNGDRLAYYKTGWESGNWNEASSSAWAIFTPFIWKDYFVNQGVNLSEERFLIYLRKIDSKKNFLRDAPVIIDPKVRTYPFAVRLKGIDQLGWAYFGTARYSIPNNRGQDGNFPNDIAGQIIQSDVAPDGTIYLVVYDKNNRAVQPRIVKCRFPEE